MINMNKILEKLLKICNNQNATIMKCNIYDCEIDVPIAIIKRSDGSLAKVCYMGEVWM